MCEKRHKSAETLKIGKNEEKPKKVEKGQKQHRSEKRSKKKTEI